MMNRAMLAIMAAGTLAAFPGPAQAQEVDIGHQDAAEVKESCEKNGGEYWEVEGGMYGCMKDCADKTCGVICDVDKGCLGYTPERRVPTTRDPNALASAINGTLRADGDVDEDREGTKWGLLGLLGLLGLAGLVARNRSRDRVDRRP